MGVWNVNLILEFPPIPHVLYGTEKKVLAIGQP